MRGSAVSGRSAAKLARICASLGLAAAFVAIGARGTQTAIANGDTRSLSFYHTHSKERLAVTFKKNGKYDPDALKKLNHFLRDWRNHKETRMEPRLFDVIWEVQKDVGSRSEIHIVSAYRSPETNETLRSRSKGVAKNSQHTLGRAIDMHFPDANMSKVREAGLRLQRGGVGFYPASALPFVHLDVGNVRHWPRMSRDQLVRLFPDGRTVHLPADGKPLKNYALAMADIQKKGGSVRPLAGGETLTASATPAKGRGLLSRMLGGDDEDDTPAAPATPAAPQPEIVPAAAPEAAPAAAPAATPAPAAVMAIAAAVPMPVARPTIAAAYAPEPQLAFASPEMVWSRGADAHAGRAATSYDAPATTNAVALPMPRPATTPAAVIGEDPAPVPVLRPSQGATVTASLAPASDLAASSVNAARLLADALREKAGRVEAPAPAVRHNPIAAAHEAFAPKPQQTASVTPQQTPAAKPQQTAALKPLAKGAPRPSLRPWRTARDRAAPLAHPNFHQANLIAPPANVLPVTFGGNPNAGLRSDAFLGASVAVIRTVSFAPRQTAELRSPRG